MLIYELVVLIEGLIMILLLVSFYILGERKILSYIQLRKGPNKVGLCGLVQSFADFLKLLSKVNVHGFNFRSWFSVFGCIVMVVCFLVSVEIYGMFQSGIDSWYALLYFLVVFSFLGYGILLLGWCSWSKYSLISCIRVSFSNVMFEMIFMCILILFGYLYFGYGDPGISSVLVLIVPIGFLCWLVVLVSENNRTPLDYGECESELVSGVTVEYSSVLFLVIFACEYAMMFIFSWISSFVFWGSSCIIIVLHLILFIMMRGSFPRVRFDSFVQLVWEYSVIMVVSYLVVLFGL
ncbi:NADH dehydrogenase subunit 1 (mitochondrion) [Schistosoma mansoni]|nr:NADH dehydrogenase subunit 1 [Schistosoma mansoni]|eukprot:NP_066216.3 NADH dehydrogenase subunit 1 (mitochondrion) [Schistosoma mansoni]